MSEGRSPAAIGARIKELRQKRGLKSSELAKRLNVSVAAVSQWEKGRTPPRQSLLQPLADALLTHATYILTGEGDPDTIPQGNQFSVPAAAVYVIDQARQDVADALGVPVSAVRIQISIPTHALPGPVIEMAD